MPAATNHPCVDVESLARNVAPCKPTDAPQGRTLAEVLAEVARLAPDKLRHFKRAYTTGSLRGAITARCLLCKSYDVAAIKACSSAACPLHTSRPYQPTSEKAARVASPAEESNASTEKAD